MDLNDDGNVDVLSGSYSRMEQDMAGIFQVLWGKEDKTFSAAETLNGTDGQPLLLPGTRDENMTDRICTRPIAADINGDGHLDIVTGNFTGTFYIFLGEGQGKFSPESKIISAPNGPLNVQAHSDPFLVDWDGDTDLDIVSGSNAGGVYLSTNTGTTTEPVFAEMTDLISKASQDSKTIQFGDSHVSGPQAATRVWVDDINDDGKLDVLVGDSQRLMYLADGVEEHAALAKMEEWKKKQEEVSNWWMEYSKGVDLEAVSKLQIKKRESESQAKGEGDNVEDSLSEEERATLETYEKSMKEYNERLQELSKARNEFVRDEMTGFVWLYYQK